MREKERVHEKGNIHQPSSFLKRLREKERGHEKGNIHQPSSFLKRLREKERGHEKDNIHQTSSFLKGLREKERGGYAWTRVLHFSELIYKQHYTACLLPVPRNNKILKKAHLSHLSQAL